jgi:long-chain acyl-CoA synthetase
MPADYPTLPQRLIAAVDRSPDSRAQIHKLGDQWKEIPAREMFRCIAGFSRALSEMGVREGDRVALFAPNCPEWHVADFAVTGLGAVVVPIYFRESPDRIAYILGHSEAKVAFVAGDEQIARLLAMRSDIPGVERIIVAAGPSSAPLDDALQYETLVASAGQAEVGTYRRGIAKLRSAQLASIIYTSGTTGEPKGVMLSHANFVSNEMASFQNLSYGPDDLAVSFLPLSHVYERLTDYCYLFRNIPIAYVARPDDVAQALRDVRPTFAAAVPRFFEKLYATVMERGAQATGFRRHLFNWAVRTARRAIPWRAYGRPVSPITKLQWELADRLVYKKFREGVGGRMRLFISGGAPLATELAEFFTRSQQQHHRPKPHRHRRPPLAGRRSAYRR